MKKTYIYLPCLLFTLFFDTTLLGMKRISRLLLDKKAKTIVQEIDQLQGTVNSAMKKRDKAEAVENIKKLNEKLTDKKYQDALLEDERLYLKTKARAALTATGLSVTWLGLDFLGEIIVNNYEARFNNVRPLLATSAGFGAYTFWTYKKWVALNRDPHDLIVAMRSKLQRDMGTILSEEHIVKKQKEDIETLIKEYEEDTKK